MANVHKMVDSKSSMIVTAFRQLPKLEHEMRENLQASTSLIPEKVLTTFTPLTFSFSEMTTEIDTVVEGDNDSLICEKCYTRSFTKKTREIQPIPTF